MTWKVPHYRSGWQPPGEERLLAYTWVLGPKTGEFLCPAWNEDSSGFPGQLETLNGRTKVHLFVATCVQGLLAGRPGEDEGGAFWFPLHFDLSSKHI